MKKYATIFLLLVGFCELSFFNLFRPNLSELYNKYSGEYYLYSMQKEKNSIKNGNYNIIKTCPDKQLYLKCAEELVLYNNIDFVFEIIKENNWTIIKQDENFSCNLYLYSPKIKSYYYIGKDKVNIQIFCENNTIKIGTPIILGFV